MSSNLDLLLIFNIPIALLYDHRASWDSREGLNAGFPLLDHVRLNTGPPNSSRFVVSDSDSHELLK